MMTTEGLRLCGITYPVSKRCNVKTQPEQIIRDEQAVFTEVVGEVNQGLFSHRLLYNWTSFYNHSSRLLLIRQNAGLRHLSFRPQATSIFYIQSVNIMQCLAKNTVQALYTMMQINKRTVNNERNCHNLCIY